MGPNDKGILTYHVVPRFDIAAKGGPLALGTIVTNLKRLVPLNRGSFHVEVPEDLKYMPVCQTQFKDTLIKAREANFSAWFKALGVSAGASVNAGCSRDLEKTVSCDSIITSYFDPDPAGDYMRQCLAAKPIQAWLDASNKHTANLYMITGLKVARNLKFNKSSAAEMHARAGIEAKEPHTSAVEGGVSVDVSGSTKQDLEFGVDDIIIGYRVQYFQCVRKRFRKERSTKDKGILEGNLMNHRGSEAEQPETTFKLLPIPEEMTALEQAIADNATECWIQWEA